MKLTVQVRKDWAKIFKPREPMDDDHPELYWQSDKELVLQNIELCVDFLEILETLHY